MCLCVRCSIAIAATVAVSPLASGQDCLTLPFADDFEDGVIAAPLEVNADPCTAVTETGGVVRLFAEAACAGNVDANLELDRDLFVVCEPGGFGAPIDLRVDFTLHQFPQPTTSSHAVRLVVRNALSPGGAYVVERRMGSQGPQHDYWSAHTGLLPDPLSQPPASGTAGSLRLVRSEGEIRAYYREQGDPNWQLIRSWVDDLDSRVWFFVGLDRNSSDGGDLEVSIDDLRLVDLTPAPTGACCLADGACVVTSEADCVGAGGTYAGDESICFDAGCEPSGCPADLTGDDMSDVFDLLAYLDLWFAGCP